MLPRVAVAIVRATCWSVLAGVLITLALWLRTSPELRAGFQLATWLALSSALVFVPSLAMELGVAHLLLELGSEQRDKPLGEWFRVSWDTHRVTLDVAPPGRDTWVAEFEWDAISRVCFKAEGLELSDGIYVFTVLRPESYVIPIEAAGGLQFWNEVIRRGLFDAELAIEAASAPEGLFCWPRS